MTLKCFLIAVAMCWSVSAWANDDFETHVLAIDTIPSRTRLDSLDPQAQGRLITTATDPNKEPWARVRAVNLLSAYPNVASRTVLELLSHNPDASLRGQALYTLARTFGQPGDIRLVTHLREALKDHHAQVQTLALRGLRCVDDPAAARLLKTLANNHDETLAQLARPVRHRTI